MELLSQVTIYIADTIQKFDPLSNIRPHHTGDFWDGMGGYIKVEAKTARYFLKNNHLTIEFIPKGKRNFRHFSETGKLSLVIFSGWGHPEPPVKYIVTNDQNLEVTSMKYPSFSEQYRKEFDEMLLEYMHETGITPLKDFRETLLGTVVQTVPSNDFEGFNQSRNTQISVEKDMTFVEGQTLKRIANVYVRDRKAREVCINHYGLNCTICGFNFGKFYGTIAEGFIHVHHLTPISNFKEEHLVDPINDLRPVCANCHSILHIRTPPYSIEELKEEIEYNKIGKPPII